MFKIGDVVMLRAGGPHMTVDLVPFPATGEVRCVWNSTDGAPHVYSYPVGALVAFKTDKELAEDRAKEDKMRADAKAAADKKAADDKAAADKAEAANKAAAH